MLQNATQDTVLCFKPKTMNFLATSIHFIAQTGFVYPDLGIYFMVVFICSSTFELRLLDWQPRPFWRPKSQAN